MDVPTPKDLLDAVDRFLERHPAIGESRFGREATGEPGLLARLRERCNPTLEIMQRIKAYMERRDAEAGFGADHVATDTASDGSASHGKTEEISTRAPAGDAPVREGAPA